MGNQQTILQQISIYKPPLNQLILKNYGNNFQIYQHKFKGYQLMAHKVNFNSQNQLPYIIQNFKARYQHHYLVSTQFLSFEDYSVCGGHYEGMIFYQRIFTNLSKIKDIPFQDVLHFYAVAFKGFQILFYRFGYFQIYEEMFHLGQDAKLKVWCHKDISKNEPQQYLKDKNGTEQDMIRKIIFIVSQNTDSFTDKINLKQKLMMFGVRNFQMAHQSLRQICRQYNLSIPQRLQCLSSLNSEEVRMMLDLYTVNSNQLLKNVQLNGLTQNSNNPLPVPNNSSNNSNTIITNLPLSNINPINRSQLLTPQFNRPQPALHTPITQQFVSYSPHQQSNTPTKKQYKQTQQSMIHTFNRRPQIPEQVYKKGINLSLNQNRQKAPSLHKNKLLDSRNRSAPIYSNNINVLNKTRQNLNMLNKNPQVRINVLNNNQLINQNYNNQNIVQRFNKTMYPPQFNNTSNIRRVPINQRTNNHLQQKVYSNNVQQPIKSQIVYTQPVARPYYSQPHSNQPIKINLNQQPIINKPINYLSNANYQKTIRPTQNLKKSTHSIQYNNSSLKKSYSTSNINQPVQANYQPNQYQYRQRRLSSQQNNNNQQKIVVNPPKNDQINIKTINPPSLAQYSSNIPLIINSSNPQNSTYKQKIKPFQFSSNNIDLRINKNNQGTIKVDKNNLHLQVPLSPPPYVNPQFNAHSASSRYLYSNKDLNDNIPDFKYKKVSSPKKQVINKLFDTKIQQLQSFNESKFGTQNSLKQNSRVLQIIGRQKKDSITSAFENQEVLKKNDEIKQFNFENKNNNDNLYSYGNSFTDPKILQILKRPASNALKSELSSIKKVSKPTKPFDFNEQILKRPTINKQIKQDILKLDSWQLAGQKSKQNINIKNNISNLQGFPSLSNLSEINKVQQNSFNQDKLNILMSNKRNSFNKKSRFSQEKGSNKKQQNGLSEFYNFQYQSPTYQYSFSSKRQAPIQDNDWRTKYATTTTNSLKDQSTTLQKTNDFKVMPQKPFNFMNQFNSNQSLASLQYELSSKLSNKNLKDTMKQSIATNNKYQTKFKQYKSITTEVTTSASTRKYNPKLDPQISKDLQRFRKQRQQVTNK